MSTTWSSQAKRPAAEVIPRLFETHHAHIRRLGLHLLDGNAADADDLVQETFLRAYAAWGGFEGRAKPSTWLYTIAWRTAARMRRRRSGEPRRLERLSDAGQVVDGWTSTLDPLDTLIAGEEERRVHEALEALPIRYRLPVSLKELGGLSVDEVGEVLHLSDGTVKSRLHRGRAALAEILEPQPESPSGRRSRARTPCPHCRPITGSGGFARHACEVAETGAADELRALLGLEPAAESNELTAV